MKTFYNIICPSPSCEGRCPSYNVVGVEVLIVSDRRSLEHQLSRQDEILSLDILYVIHCLSSYPPPPPPSSPQTRMCFHSAARVCYCVSEGRHAQGVSSLSYCEENGQQW